MLKKILAGLGAVIVIILVLAAFQPSGYSVSRELLVNATPEALFPYINNARKSYEWMPWREADPDLQMTYSGPAEGLGSTSSWESDGPMGAGKAVVVQSTPNQVVKTELSYTEPMEMTQTAEMSLTPAAGGTIVRWSVTGQNSFIGRVMCLFMSMDKVVGGEFEKGLAKLKTLAEGGAQ